jgi:hypothetical protein
MRAPFFITGLPRSRTAWLANLFTTDTTICYHDKPFDDRLCENAFKRVGFCGSELLADYDRIKALYPTAKWVLIRRSLDDSTDSFKCLLRDHGITIPDRVVEYDLRLKQEKLDRHHSFNGMVEYGALNDMIAVRRLWECLLPDKPFDTERFRLLDELRIEQHFEKAMANRKELFSWLSPQ